MPVEVVDTLDPEAADPKVVTVEHVCEGCGETIRTFEAFEDTVDRDAKPLHDSISCERLARHADREPEDTAEAEAVLEEALDGARNGGNSE